MEAESIIDFNPLALSSEDTREKLRAACAKNDSNGVLVVFDGYDKDMREMYQKLQEECQSLKNAFTDYQKKKGSQKLAMKKTLHDYEKKSDQYKKLQGEFETLREENAGLKRTIRGMKAFNKMSEGKRTIMLTRPKCIVRDDNSSSAAPYKAAPLKFKPLEQVINAKPAIQDASSANHPSLSMPAGMGPGAPGAMPAASASFQATLTSGFSSLFSLMSSDPAQGMRSPLGGIAAIPETNENAGALVGGSSSSSNSNMMNNSTGNGGDGQAEDGTDKGKKRGKHGTDDAVSTGGDSETPVKKKQRNREPGKSAYVSFPLFKRLLHHYKEMYGHLVVMKSFIVPCDNSWPEDMWGIKLGMIAMRVRCVDHFKQHRQELEELGFDFSPRMNTYEWEDVRQALQTFKHLNGHLTVKQAFVVPANNPQWPQNLRGMKLGQVLGGIRVGGYHKERHEELRAMGVDFYVKLRGPRGSKRSSGAGDMGAGAGGSALKKEKKMA